MAATHADTAPNLQHPRLQLNMNFCMCAPLSQLIQAWPKRKQCIEGGRQLHNYWLTDRRLMKRVEKLMQQLLHD